jgi:hypothetical protein
MPRTEGEEKPAWRQKKEDEKEGGGVRTIRLLLGFSLVIGLCFAGKSLAGNIGDPGAAQVKGTSSLGAEFSGVYREIRDGNGIRYDTESWRLLFKGTYGITDWLEGYARAGGVTLKIRGTPFDSNPGGAAGAGLKATFLDPPGHPLRYSIGGQFLFLQAGDRDSTGQWLEYDLWLGTAYKDWKNLIPYGGIVYSRVDGKMRGFPAKPALDEFKSPTPMGVFFGVDWKLRPAIHLGIDARLGGENSGTFSVRYQF